jgi:arginyl-tRNA synthetase
VEYFNGNLRFVVCQFGRQWSVQSISSDLASLITDLQSTYSSAQALHENVVKRVLNRLNQNEDEDTDSEAFISSINKVLSESLCPLYVVKNDKKFRNYFKIDENLDVPITVKRGTIPAAGAAVAPTTKYISFLS